MPKFFIISEDEFNTTIQEKRVDVLGWLSEEARQNPEKSVSSLLSDCLLWVNQDSTEYVYKPEVEKVEEVEATPEVEKAEEGEATPELPFEEDLKNVDLNQDFSFPDDENEAPNLPPIVSAVFEEEPSAAIEVTYDEQPKEDAPEEYVNLSDPEPPAIPEAEELPQERPTFPPSSAPSKAVAANINLRGILKDAKEIDINFS